jgi:tRNA threonylcarbamoyladenosine biosynthesis protein TsaB
MRILAIETSGRDASLALLEGGDGNGDGNRGDGDAARLVGEVAVTGPERTAQILAPRLSDLLQTAGWPTATIRLVVVAVGPGSFTGLRIGVTTAKTFAYAVGAEVIGVNTLAVIASQAPRSAAPLWVVMDAQRQELFTAKFDAERKLICATRILSQSEWLAALEPGDEVTGPGLRRLLLALPADVGVVDESKWVPMATAVGQLGWREYQTGRRDDLWQLLPKYYRASAAEEKRDKEAGRQGDKETI